MAILGYKHLKLCSLPPRSIGTRPYATPKEGGAEQLLFISLS